MTEAVDLIGLLVVLLAVACTVLLVVSRLGLPPVVGYLLSGIVLGPNVMGHLSENDAVSSLAEIGLLLLMFTIGLEFDTQYFMRIRRAAIGGGVLQIGLTILGAVALTPFLGLPPATGVVVGCILALSSTAVVLKSLMDHGLLDSLAGRISLGILIFQDLSIVPMMILLPISRGSAETIVLDLVGATARAGFLLGITLLLNRRVMPRFLHLMAASRNQELFLLGTLTLCLGMAWVSHLFGVSYALGAFLAGLILGGTDYAHQMNALILPFRDVFAGVFFVAMGMLFDPRFALGAWEAVLLLLVVIIAGKAILTTIAVAAFRFPLTVALQVGLNLAQVGEFSFLLALMARAGGLIDERVYKVFIAAAVCSMLLAPLVTRFSPALVAALGRFGGGFMPAWERLAQRYERSVLDVPGAPGVAASGKNAPTRHAVILGYGTVGRALGDVLLSNGVPFVALELDPDVVRVARRRGHPVLYGDSSSEDLLRRCGVDRARMVLVTLPDPVMSRRVIRSARHMNPDLFILARGRRATEDQPLYDDGADEVIHETFEVGIEFIARVLRRMHVPKQEIERQVGRVRSGRYDIFRRRDFEPLPIGDVRATLDSLRVEFLALPAASPLAHRHLRDAGIREATGALVLAVIRDGNVTHAPDADFVLLPGDTLLVSGAVEQVAQAEALIDPPVPEPNPA
ncbi:MAG TPA: cation:proton antiporter [Candidatus Polarisedimenticolia bacterium]|nr:cation:proton antiporter [Candidatus Polarisedimenticolia bacterium]